MHSQTIEPDDSIALFVKKIWTFEEPERHLKTVLPFFADGYPGLMFQDAENGLLINPHNKRMPALFLYGQTIKPIELHIEGNYELIVFQLYPFVLKSFFNIEAKEINDGCYDLAGLEGNANVVQQLLQQGTKRRIETIQNLLLNIFNAKKKNLDLVVREAIQHILDSNGQIPVGQLCKKINLTQRTFERRFSKETGLSPKQFSQIIQFQKLLEQLTQKEYTRLTDIVYENGFADQSHFIRVFKAFTGKTPTKFS